MHRDPFADIAGLIGSTINAMLDEIAQPRDAREEQLQRYRLWPRPVVAACEQRVYRRLSRRRAPAGLAIGGAEPWATVSCRATLK
jgi:hypothetical protein